MTLDEHIRVAAAALARGLIDAAGFVEVMRQAGNGDTLERIWLASGRLTDVQLAQLLAAARPGPATGSGVTLPFAAFANGTGSTKEALLDYIARAPSLGFGQITRLEDEQTGVAAAASIGTAVAPRPPTELPRSADSEELTRERTFGGSSNTRVLLLGADNTPIDPAAAADPAPTPADTDPDAKPDTAPAPGAPPPPLTRAAPPDMPLPAGARPPVRVRYERRELLGIGGLGQVTACFDTLLGRRVAVKVARTDQDPLAESILEREARIIASLEHPNIMAVYDGGAQPGIGPYYVMPVVLQPSLEQVLSRIARGDPDAIREYGLKKLLRYFVQICHAVDFAHSRGVVHCDLKPSNVLLGEFGEVLVVDWGLAWSAAYPDGPRGGTPGYMAPEQLDRTRKGFDGRTDVFALGVILYTMLCLRPAFPPLHAQLDEGDPTTVLPRERYRPAQRPSDVAPHAGIPPEVEEIAMKAIDLEPDQRWQSARDLARAVDDWLEGRQEEERRRRLADEAAASGDELSERVMELEESRREQSTELAELVATTPPWAPGADKQRLWDAEDMQAVTDALRVRTLQAAISAYEQALDHVPGHQPSRHGLARLYRLELDRAVAERHEHDRIWFEQLVQRYDDGAAEVAGTDGRLVVRVGGRCEVALIVLREDQRRLIEVDAGPISGERSVAPGRYIVEARAGGGRARWPVAVRPGLEVAVVVDAALTAGLGDGEAVVPGGPAPLGERLELADARVPAEVDVPTFVMARLPVAFADYLAFLDDVRRRAGGDARVDDLLPRDDLGAPLWHRDGDRWVPARWASDPETALRVPTIGVSAAAAIDYAAWWAERTGKPWRLPRDVEWEKAARGTDGRLYPWGDSFDPSFCKMRDSRPGPARPEPAGAFPFDESPYGVRDLAGGVAEWTLPEPGDAPDGGVERAMFSRGGAWCDGRVDCRVTVRRLYWLGDATRRVGFRLVRTP